MIFKLNQITVVVHLVAIFIFCSCTNAQQSTSGSEADGNVVENLPEQVKGTIKEAPIPKSVSGSMEENFRKYYVGIQQGLCSSGNFPMVQTEIIEPVDLIVDVSTVENDWGLKFSNLSGSADSGLAFHYVLKEINGHFYFTYIISKAARLSGAGEYSCFPFPGDRFMLLTDKGIVEAPDFSGSLQFYANKVRVYDDYPCMNTYIPASHKSIPRFTFYNFQNLKAFYDQTKAIDSATSHLHVRHGAILSSLEDGNKVFVQTPILYWGSASRSNRISNDFNLSKPYANKAMDVGHLCPPDCNVAASCN